ncbi:MAG: 1-acyl-sn-glycerol-3-phosphate acyltransferase [Clostridia bacterium]|nr:1-acyl-sn-glycerol-3-phosphate acyltransferase [Clostridia bacterium]
MSKNECTKDKSSDKKKKAKKVKFSALYCLCFLTLTRIVSRLMLHCKWKKSKAFTQEIKKGPMLILSNHLSAYDFINFSAPLYPHKVNFVVAENMMFAKPIFAKLISSYHAILKRQYFADFQCIKTIKNNLDAGISVVLCPEGKVSADGKTGAIAESTARLVEWLGYPVAVCKLEGASFVRPKWAYNKRSGKNFASYDLLFTKDEVKTLSKEEIYARIVGALAHNEHAWQTENHVEFKGERYAEGLERLLYVCPKCHEEFCLTTKDDQITCSHCGNKIRYTHTGELEPVGEDSKTFERIDLWFDYERSLAAEEVKKDDFRLEDKAKLFVENAEHNGYRYACDGTLSLDKNFVRFVADGDVRVSGVESQFKVNDMKYEQKEGEVEPIEDDFKDVSFNISNSDTIANQPGAIVDMYDEKHIYRFMLKDRLASTKYTLCVEENFKNRR